MAVSKEYLLKRIETAKARYEKAEAALARAQKKLADLPKRIQKGKFTDNELWDLEYHNKEHLSAEDFFTKEYTEKVREAEEKVNIAKIGLDGAEAEMKSFEEKAASRNIKPILDFLEEWKNRVRTFYVDHANKAKELKSKVKAGVKTLINEYHPEVAEQSEWKQKDYFNMVCSLIFSNGEIDKYDYNKTEKNAIKEEPMWQSNEAEELRSLAKQYHYSDNICDHLVSYSSYQNEIDMNELNKMLNQEADNKYDFIIERTNRIVGQITDASNLSIGNKGDLNGRIDGPNGSAWVETIGAGGYNIQCFHFSTLIKPIRMAHGVKEAEQYMN